MARPAFLARSSRADWQVWAALLIVYAALTWLVSIGIGMLHRRLNRDMQAEVR